MTITQTILPRQKKQRLKNKHTRIHGVASPVFKDLSLLDNLWKELKLRAEKQQPRNLKEPTQFLTSM